MALGLFAWFTGLASLAVYRRPASLLNVTADGANGVIVEKKWPQLA